MKDLAKRKIVMGRSMQLGHCICNPKKPCPCDVFREKDLCPCAGEREDAPPGPVRLMDLVEYAGCASKIDAATLKRALHGLPFPDDPRVLIGAPAGDDAGVFEIAPDLALVQTVDVFSPSVDDPYTFGQIAAANSLSDIYAMGGRPITALSIVGFPSRAVSESVMREILRGGIDKMNEAGVPVIGGHSINDNELKAGFAVTGLIHPAKIAANAGARPGDALILTKPLGTGIVAFAAQIGRAPAGSLEAAARSMARLNDRAAKLMLESGARACTDVTGFGLVGHLSAMAAASKVDVELFGNEFPLLPGVWECLGNGILSGAVERNRESFGERLVADENVPPPLIDLCFDPQTSGGLLMAVPESAAAELLARLHAQGMAEAAVIGKVASAGSGGITLRYQGRMRLSAASTEYKKSPQAKETTNMDCCAHHHESDSPAAGENGGVAAIEQKFLDFLQAANAPGALDGKTKRAVAIALSVLARCEPCVNSHLKKAREEGFSQAEIDEAAWVAIAFGGSPTMVFYRGLRKS
ncbi:MAG: selenide, water dikinase SelD [Pirellulales bacterium]|nr:selenide, water dikinase SelD [Pirellulales bacterium]